MLNDFESIQSQFEDKDDEINSSLHLEEREIFQAQYFKYMAISSCIANKAEKVETKQPYTCSRSIVKLPTISLPSFDGQYDGWLEFRDTYMSLIHNSKDIDPIQKFHYLRSSLSGSALQIIKSLEFTAENYDIAWGLLENCYNDKRLLIHNHVKALFALPSVNKESPSPNLRALDTLGEPTASWDTLIIYNIVSRLDSSTEREWEEYKGTLSDKDNSCIISLDKLIKFLKDRADVLEMIKVSSSNKNTHENYTKKTKLLHTHTAM